MEYIDLIQRTLDYVDENIKSKITIEELAAVAGFSKYHFYRVFGSFTGYTVREYINKRKLEYAAVEIKEGKSILDVALDYGFETHSGFTRSFKKHLGMRPRYYIKGIQSVKPSRISLRESQEKNLLGIVMEPRVEINDAIETVGIETENSFGKVLRTSDIPAFWAERGWDEKNYEGRLYRAFGESKHGEYCICTNVDIENGSFSYVLAIELCDNQEKREGYHYMSIPEGKYAVFTTPKVMEDELAISIRGCWKYILEEWFSKVPYEIDPNRPDFEYYDNRCHPWEYKKVCMEIYVPII